ncbi:hypothetical protein V8E53_015506, partial [Lactarius tabidus]
IPIEVFEDPAYYSRLETMVSDILTSTCSSTKQKIELSFRDNGNALHIGLLSQRLLPRNVLATMDHWVRFAFLSAFQDFVNFTWLKKPAGALRPLRKRPNHTCNLVGLKSNELDTLSASMSESLGAPASGDGNDNSTEPNLEGDDDDSSSGTPITGKEYTLLQFWNYVNDYLEYIRTVPFASIQDSAERNCKIAWSFNEALQVDVYNYRDGSKIPLSPSSDIPPMWQQVLHCSAHWED